MGPSKGKEKAEIERENAGLVFEACDFIGSSRCWCLKQYSGSREMSRLISRLGNINNALLIETIEEEEFT